MWQKKWVMGNWKMNGSIANNSALLNDLLAENIPENVYVGLAVPSVYIQPTAAILENSAIQCGAEDVSMFAQDGAYTGEVSARMLSDVGAQFVLVGHSERRQYFKESNECLLNKMNHAHQANLIPILCIGESLAERQSGQEQSIIAAQLQLLKEYQGSKQIAVAYEPVWAIGTGEVASTEQIRHMHAFIKEQILSLIGEDVTIRILYGGSVNANNAAQILKIEHVHGALVGGASLQCAGFSQIIQDAQ